MFAGLLDKDFDAYLPNKWKSNVFNRERLEVKQKLLELGREVAGAMVAADGSPLLLEASAEHPALWNHKQVEAQHLYFSRHTAARREIDGIIDRSRPMSTMLEDPTPQRNHLFLGVSMNHEALQVALKLHPDAHVDRQNLERKLEDTWEREKFLDLVRALPTGTEVGVLEGGHGPASELEAAQLRGLLADLARPEAPGRTHWFAFTRRLPRAAVVAAGAGVVETVRAELAALLPIYHFIAWSRDNDFVSMKEQIRQEKTVKRQKGLSKNDRVKIVRGMFSGRTGVVQEIDAKGALKVLVGTVAVKVGADEVEKS
jgi:transcription antitermination factor NusG